jgi:hypothetical protein
MKLSRFPGLKKKDQTTRCRRVCLKGIATKMDNCSKMGKSPAIFQHRTPDTIQNCPLFMMCFTFFKEDKLWHGLCSSKKLFYFPESRVFLIWVNNPTNHYTTQEKSGLGWLVPVGVMTLEVLRSPNGFSFRQIPFSFRLPSEKNLISNRTWQAEHPEISIV